ncbi:MAG: S1 RNA-binding domain-containing protein [Pirellulales bacterium]|nr:S1 RNA-binding domain-containing protein [Pirellulales bacterium]
MTNDSDLGREEPVQTPDSSATPDAPGNGDPSLAADANTEPVAQEVSGAGGGSAPKRAPRILIGSQRDRGSVTPRAKRDWYVPGEDSEKPAEEPVSSEDAPNRAEVEGPLVADAKTDLVEEPTAEEPAAPPAQEGPSAAPPPSDEPTDAEPAARRRHFPPPSRRSQLPTDLEAEFEAALGDAPLEELLATDETVSRQATLEPESRMQGRVVAVEREDVFVELAGSREQGVVPLPHFAQPPEVGAVVDVIVKRFNREDGLYELGLPHAAVNVGDWSDLTEGMIVDARITGHNAGGLECEVNHIRGFIPVSQISLYRVEDLAQFVGEKFSCLVTEANPQRRNLVLSHRAVLEREKEEARQNLLESLAPGQIHEGVVRKLMDFGAFVDLGGVDGLLHISQLGWGRVNHPSDVLAEGQRIQVKIQKIDLESNRISLGYREMLANPWDDAARKYPVNTVVKGKVAKLMEFGAFVELEPGVEGLVHISELAHKRVWRASDVVAEGQEVEVMVKSFDAKAQRIGLSMKDVLPVPETQKKDEPTDEDLAAAMPKPGKQRPAKPLRGGLGRAAGGDRFGLKW